MNSENRNILRMNHPASWWGAMWRDGLPSGNGSTGALVYGGVHEETIMLTHGDLWWKGHRMELPDVSGILPEMRKMLLDGRVREAEPMLSNSLKSAGYRPNVACPLPLGDLKVIMPVISAFKNYSRSLNMETGEITVSWCDGCTNYKRSLFVSRTEDIVAILINREGPDPVNAHIFLDLHDRRDIRTPYYKPSPDLPQNMESISGDDFIYYASGNDDGTDFGAVLKVQAIGGSVISEENLIRVVNADKVLIYCKLFVKGNRTRDWERLKDKLSKLRLSYEALLKDHIETHSSIFNSVKFDLNATGRGLSNEELLLVAYSGDAPAALFEKMWSYGRYLLISSTRPGGNPCPLMGLWCGEYEGFWSFNMANENLQMIYWQALSGNMPELLLPIFDYFERMIDDFRLNARNLFGCRGIYIPAVTAPGSGLISDLQPHIIHWTGAAGWIAQYYYDYFLHTRDIEFLKKKAMPFLKETALFYEDYFFTGDDGCYISCPSNSPENTPGNFRMDGGRLTDMSVAINATMDFAIARELLMHLVEAAGITGQYGAEVDKWKTMLERIPPYQINDDGAVREWMHPAFEDNYHHRHQSHIYPVFPGIEITKEKDGTLFNGFKTALEKRLSIGITEQTGWSLAHMSNAFARLGEGNLALECLNLLSRSCLMNNLYSCHNDWRRMGIGVDMDWAPFQIDANMGWSAAVQEMLLFSEPGKIKILPALPDKWRKGCIEGLLSRGGISVGISWNLNNGIVSTELSSLKEDQIIDLILPKPIISGNHSCIDGNKAANIYLKANVKRRFNFMLKIN